MSGENFLNAYKIRSLTSHVLAGYLKMKSNKIAYSVAQFP